MLAGIADLKRTVVPLHNAMTKRQPQTGAFTHGFGGKKGIEYTVFIFIRKSFSARSYCFRMSSFLSGSAFFSVFPPRDSPWVDPNGAQANFLAVWDW